MDVRALGYIGFEVGDPRAWRVFGTEVCGLMPSRTLPGTDRAPEGEGVAEDGSVYLTLDERQWRVALHPGAATRLAYLGLELASEAALERALEELLALGVEASAGTPAQARARGVGALVVLHDPDGQRIELFAAPATDRRFVSPTGAHFRTGALGLGHANLFVRDARESLDFYLRVLGFQYTDRVRFGPDMGAHFLRCNARHHSLALTTVGGATGIQHLLFEVGDVDEVGRALDRATQRGIRITASLGRHANDRMLSFYMESPAGFEVEIGCDGMLVDPDWVQNEFVEGDLWGHHGLTAEHLEAAAQELD
jgi:3,4-dihydroxy-9,10-secoandrosta-1,3,5(10)-triene-9,17-dione 4,5-dioxygenase